MRTTFGTAATAVVITATVLMSLVAGDRHASVQAHSPHDPVTTVRYRADQAESGVVFSIVSGRLMRSDDRGLTWREIVNGIPGSTDPLVAIELASVPSIGYGITADGIVLRTDDGGETWQRRTAVAPDNSRLRVSPSDPDVLLVFGAGDLLRSVDGGESWTAAPVRGGIGDLRFSPDGSSIVRVSTRGAVTVSADAGRTWAGTGQLDVVDAVRIMTIVASDGGATLLAGTAGGELVASDDRGATTTQLGAGLPTDAIRSLVSADEGGVLWLSMRGSGAFRSDDLGATWTAVDDGLTIDPQAAERRDADWNDIAAAADGSGEVLLAGFDGLFALAPGADAWREVQTLAEYLTGFALSPAYDEDGTVFVATYVRGALRSIDGGETWTSINDGLERWDDDTLPAPVWRLHNLRISPAFAVDRTLFSATWQRLLRSTDGGESWRSIWVGSSAESSPLRQLVIALSPNFATDATMYAGTKQGELLRSTSNGDPGTWEPAHQFESRIRSIAIDRAGTMLVGTLDGVYQHDASGGSWERWNIELDDRSHGVQVALSPAFGDDGRAMAATADGLYETRDGGDRWVAVDAGLGPDAATIEAVAFSPAFADDGLILVSTREGGLLRSVDGGSSFEQIDGGLRSRNLLIADFANPTSTPLQFSPDFADDRTIYAVAQDTLVRSTDAGLTWDPVELPGLDAIADELRRPGRPVWPMLAVAGVAVLGIGLAGLGIDRRRRSRRLG